tara:strand:+ start:8961 stop:9680 length:720 start_codon:yes stop_codon:yes gene_type:complete
MLRPRSGAQQWVSKDEYKITPNTSVHEFTDTFGNLCQRLIAPVSNFKIETFAQVKTIEHFDEAPGAEFVEIQNLPDSIVTYLLPSRYCESDRFGMMGSELTQHLTPGYDQVHGIEEWLKQNIKYLPFSSEYPISAVEVNAQQSGVCRDLAHLGIALCRSISIPARMVVGYLVDLKPMDMHAWFEAYIGGRWYTFDATQTGSKGGYVAVGYGRDAADVAMYNQFGLSVYDTKQVIKVERI